MTPPESEDFARAIARLAALFRVELDTGVIADYAVALQDLSIRSLLRAIDTARAELEHFPRPGELRRLCYRPSSTPDAPTGVQRQLDLDGREARRRGDLTPIREALAKLRVLTGERAARPSLTPDQEKERRAELLRQAAILRRHEPQ